MMTYLLASNSIHGVLKVSKSLSIWRGRTLCN